MTLRVAVTGVSGDVGLGAIVGLRAGDVWILGLDASADCAGYHLADAGVQMPPVADGEYVDRLREVLDDQRIDVLLPGIDSEIVVLSRARERFTGHTQIALAPADLVEAADDKLATAAYLEARGVAVAVTRAAADAEQLTPPLVAKPRRGQASKGVVRLDDSAAVRRFLDEERAGYCVQQYLEGPEITAGLLYDREGVLQDAIAMERTLEGGRTVRATVIDTPEIRGFLESFGARVRGAGAINIQFRVDPACGPTVFEINARLSGSTAFRVAVGFNDPLRLALHLGRGAPIERASVQRATVYRYATTLMVPA